MLARLVRRSGLTLVVAATVVIAIANPAAAPPIDSDLTGGFALAAPGELDTSFGNGGYSLANLPNYGGVDLGNAVTLQPDGKIVVAGVSNVAGSNDFAVVRLLPDGPYDPSFGNGGYSLANLPNYGGSDVGNAVTLQPDGKIVVAGFSNVAGSYDIAVVRLLPDGPYDPSFGNGGYSLVDFGPYAFGNAVALQPDGKIVVAGGGNDNLLVARLHPNGLLDTTFGAGGKSIVDLGGEDSGNAVALQPDGKIVVVGYRDGNIGVARLQPNGLLDTTFGAGGKSIVDLGGGDYGNAVALQQDGKIVVVGSSTVAGGDNILVARLQPNGLLDTTFGAGGKSIVDLGGSDWGSAVALQPDGKIVVAGYTNKFGSWDFAVVRLQGDPVVGGGPGGSGPGGGDPGSSSEGPPIGAWASATVVGTAGNDILEGTKGADVIAGLEGKDTLRGLSGNDRICGGPGNDNVVGGAGKDRLLGQRDNDRLLGGVGADRLLGGVGRDRLIGGPGFDTLLGGPGADFQQQ